MRMKMSKTYKRDQDYDLTDKLKRENKKLKREIKQLRKLLDRFEVSEEKGLIEEGVILPSKKRQKEQELKKRWTCHQCSKGILRLIIVGNRYFRKCDNCDKHTKSQIWDDSVEGIR